MDLSRHPHRPARMPSPTLTDPDMILPTSHAEQDTSPIRQADSSSALPEWHHAPTGEDGQMKSAMRNLLGNGHSLRHKGSEKSLKIQEASDIRPQSKQSELSQRSAGSTLASSPLLHEDFGFKSMRDTRAREESNDHWDTVDDGSVISESISPLVEAEREGYLMSENGGLNGYKFSDRFRKAIVEEDDESYSHAAMSVRAEEILANAKKRLTEMESNLNRARHTVNRPSSSMSSFNAGSDGQSLYTLPSNISPSKHRQHNSPPSTSGSKGHSRVLSETSVPSSMQTSPPQREDRTDDVRSSSAMGLDAKQGSESRDWFWTGLTRNTSHGNRLKNSGLQPLNEDGPAPATFESPERQHSPPIGDEVLDPMPPSDRDLKDSALQHNGSSANGLTRARSTNQMRDIRDQMQDLKGKISSLKQRAREDSLRRRSLQSLRTPSPFTAAEQWYHGAAGVNRDRSRSRPRGASPPKIQPVIEEEAETKHYPVQESDWEASEPVETAMDGLHAEQQGSPKHSSTVNGLVARENDDSPKTVIDGSINNDADRTMDQTQLEEPAVVGRGKGTDEEIEDRDEDMLEPPALPIGGRHEDRPDAFDYEHLFLHSRMGTLGQGAKSRSSSHSSTYSVETTKPSIVAAAAGDAGNGGNECFGESPNEEPLSDARSSIHERKGSVESVSTVATFATATEGEGVASDTDEEEWVYRRPMAGSWEPEYPNKPKVAAGRRRDVQPDFKETKHTAQARSQRVAESNGADTAHPPISPRTVTTRSEGAVSDLLAFLSSSLPDHDGSVPQPIELNDSDRELAAKLVRSVAKVCGQLQAFSMEGNKYGGRPWRRRLDGARRVLDGETNGEVF
ncbi:MAG: hypothetical protein Q9218_004918 [Villophora microphyllina]